MHAFIWVMFILQVISVLGKITTLGSGKSNNKFEDIFVLVTTGILAIWSASLLINWQA